jgi:predicted nucleic acid-binding protein
MTVGLLDTSIFIARETGRPLDASKLPEHSAISVITIAELRWGVLMASDDETRSRRLDTLTAAQQLSPVPVDEHVAHAWALLRRRLKAEHKKMGVNNSWIAATAIAFGWPVVTQDGGFSSDVPDLRVIAV